MLGTCCRCLDEPWLNKSDHTQKIQRFVNEFYDQYVCEFHYDILSIASEVLASKSNHERNLLNQEVRELFNEGLNFIPEDRNTQKRLLQ